MNDGYPHRITSMVHKQGAPTAHPPHFPRCRRSSPSQPSKPPHLHASTSTYMYREQLPHLRVHISSESDRRRRGCCSFCSPCSESNECIGDRRTLLFGLLLDGRSRSEKPGSDEYRIIRTIQKQEERGHCRPDTCTDKATTLCRVTCDMT